MGSKNLIVNIGSASKKYSIFEGIDEYLFFHFEKEGENFTLTIKGEDKFEKDNLSQDDYINSVEFINNYLKDRHNILISDIYAVSFRIVATGTYFLTDRVIDEKFIEELEKVKKFSGLHLKPIVEEIEKIQKIYKDQKLFGISDSTFHKTKLEESKYYGISKDMQDKNDYKRFGYHGISVQSVVDKILEVEGKIDEKVLVCHLGGGISITSLKNGKSLDNSMGFSPLEGPIMATRSGSVDFTLLQNLFKENNMESDESQIKFLTQDSGLFGLSGISEDLRVLKMESFKGNVNAKFAIRTYVFNLIKEIGKMVAVLKGLDTLVFTGTIGFRSNFMRELILEELRWLGVDFDLQKNSDGDLMSNYFYINTFDSKVKILVCETDEMKAIARTTLKIM